MGIMILEKVEMESFKAASYWNIKKKIIHDLGD